MRGSRGGVGGSGRPLEFAKLNIADITGNEKNSYFSFLCTSQLYVKVGPPGKHFRSAPDIYVTCILWLTSLDFIVFSVLVLTGDFGTGCTRDSSRRLAQVSSSEKLTGSQPIYKRLSPLERLQMIHRHS